MELAKVPETYQIPHQHRQPRKPRSVPPEQRLRRGHVIGEPARGHDQRDQHADDVQQADAAIIVAFLLLSCLAGW